jgi:hypothetical protein
MEFKNLDNKQNYQRELRLLHKLSINKLEQFVGELHKIRYDDNDVEVDSYYRLASHVLNQRRENKSSLIFHLKNLVVS